MFVVSIIVGIVVLTDFNTRICYSHPSSTVHFPTITTDIYYHHHTIDFFVVSATFCELQGVPKTSLVVVIVVASHVGGTTEYGKQ